MKVFQKNYYIIVIVAIFIKISGVLFSVDKLNIDKLNTIPVFSQLNVGNRANDVEQADTFINRLNDSDFIKQAAAQLPLDLRVKILRYVEPTYDNVIFLLSILEKLRVLKILEEPCSQSNCYYNKLYNLNFKNANENNALRAQQFIDRLITYKTHRNNFEKLFNNYTFYIAQMLQEKSYIESPGFLIDNYMSKLSPVSRLVVENQQKKIKELTFNQKFDIIVSSGQFKLYALVLGVMLYFYYKGVPLDIAKFIIDIMLLSGKNKFSNFKRNYIWIVAAVFSAYTITGNMNIIANFIKSACPFSSLSSFAYA